MHTVGLARRQQVQHNPANVSAKGVMAQPPAASKATDLSETDIYFRQRQIENYRWLTSHMRILACIPFFYRPERLSFLAACIHSLGSLSIDRLDLHLLTNAVEQAELGRLRRVCQMMLPRGNIELHSFADLDSPLHLPWRHKPFITDRFLNGVEPFDLFLYIEDDLLFSINNLVYWIAGRDLLRSHHLTPSFVRYEYNRNDQEYYATDFCGSAGLGPGGAIRLGDWLFVRPAFPYDGLYILDRELAQQHQNGPAFDLDTSRTLVDWGDLERAAIGPRFDGCPPNAGSSTAIAIDAVSLVPTAFSCIHHLPDTYVSLPGPHAKLRLDQLFHRSD